MCVCVCVRVLYKGIYRCVCVCVCVCVLYKGIYTGDIQSPHKHIHNTLPCTPWSFFLPNAAAVSRTATLFSGCCHAHSNCNASTCDDHTYAIYVYTHVNNLVMSVISTAYDDSYGVAKGKVKKQPLVFTTEIYRTCVGKPYTTSTISHGRQRLVRHAPCPMSPLCWRMRRLGLTVNLGGVGARA